LINLEKGEKLAGLSRIADPEPDLDSEEESGDAAASGDTAEN
jgi:hypothetical protein